MESNPAHDTLTKLGKADETPDPYTPVQMADLLKRVVGTEWEMPVMLGGLYGMRRSEILGLRWQNMLRIRFHDYRHPYVKATTKKFASLAIFIIIEYTTSRKMRISYFQF